MKVLIVIFMMFVLLPSVHADRFRAKIFEIEQAGKRGEDHLIKMENARVAFLKGTDELTLESLNEMHSRNETVLMEVDENYNLLSLQSVEEDHLPPMPVYPEQRMSYEPTVVSSYSSAASIFYRMRRDYQNDSQCYNRAHIWAYEEFNRTQLKSIKLFMFFTNRYIRNYRYKWWFHVSPMVLVKEGSSVVQRVLDRRYMGGPRYVKTWTNSFIYSRRTCPVVKKYSDYRNNQESEDCYLIPVSQYYWQPRDILNNERTGYEKTVFFQREINWALWEAF